MIILLSCATLKSSMNWLNAGDASENSSIVQRSHSFTSERLQSRGSGGTPDCKAEADQPVYVIRKASPTLKFVPGVKGGT